MSILNRNELEFVIDVLRAQAVSERGAKDADTRAQRILDKLSQADDLQRTGLTQDEVDRLWRELGIGLPGATRSQFDAAFARAKLCILSDASRAEATAEDLFGEEMDRQADEIVECLVTGEIKNHQELIAHLQDATMGCYYVSCRDYAAWAVGSKAATDRGLAILAQEAMYLVSEQITKRLASNERASPLLSEMMRLVLEHGKFENVSKATTQAAEYQRQCH